MALHDIRFKALGTAVEGFSDQVVQRHERVGGLLSPAPLSVRGRLDDSGEFAQHAGTAELMVGSGVGVVGANASWMATPANPGSTATVSIPARPRFGWQMIQV